MRTARLTRLSAAVLAIGALTITACVKKTDQGTQVVGADGVPIDADGNAVVPDANPQADPGPINPSPSAVALENRTCHNRSNAGGLSDQEILLAVRSAPGTEVTATFTVSNPAEGAPAVRTVTGTVNEGGRVFLVVPLYAQGENVKLTAIEGADAEVADYEGGADFTVATLDDPATQCADDINY